MTSQVRRLLDEVWNRGEFVDLAQLVADPYQVLHDPGDPWNGQALDRDGFRERVLYTRRAIPDVHFEILDSIESEAKVAVFWQMTGTHLGDLPMLPATGKTFSITGMTFYYLENGKIAGHRQAFDQLGFLAQIGRLQLA